MKSTESDSAVKKIGPEGVGDADRVERPYLAELLEIKSLLQKMVPEEPSNRFAKLRAKAHDLLRYVGLPALVIASVIPVYELSNQIIEFRNRDYIKSQYSNYAGELLERREYDRAQKVLDASSQLKELNAPTQYSLARVLLEKAFNQGRDYEEAEDTVSILIELHENAPIFFPKFGGDNEVRRLRLRLVDILTQRTAYAEALKELNELEADLVDHGIREEEYMVRRGKILVLQHEYDQARPLLEQSIDGLTNNTDGLQQELLGQAFHALGNLEVFTGDPANGLKHYALAEDSFRQANDKNGLVRTYANQALAFSSQHDWESARSARIRQIRTSRQLHDDLGVANALIGLCVLERRVGNYAEALRLAEEAEAAFTALSNSVGLAAAYQNKANIKGRIGQHAEALFDARRALTYFMEARDLRGIFTTLGVIGSAARATGDTEEAVFGLLGAVAFIRYTGHIATVDGIRDTAIHKRDLATLRTELGPAEFGMALRSAQSRIQGIRQELELDVVDSSLDLN